jgi:hypothetical protein
VSGTIREELHINCPPAAAFDLMADVRRTTDWNGGISSAEMTSTGDIGKGSRFVAVNRGQRMESIITTFDRPGLLEFATTGGALDVTGRFWFTSAGPGTDLVIELEPSPKGYMKVLLPVLKPMIRRDLATQHAKLKDSCESQDQSPPAPPPP